MLPRAVIRCTCRVHTALGFHRINANDSIVDRWNGRQPPMTRTPFWLDVISRHLSYLHDFLQLPPFCLLRSEVTLQHFSLATRAHVLYRMCLAVSWELVQVQFSLLLHGVLTGTPPSLCLPIRVSNVLWMAFALLFGFGLDRVVSSAWVRTEAG